MARSLTLRALITALAAFAVVPASASALPGAHVAANKLLKHVDYPDIQHLHYEYGPIQIMPGQNNIEARINQNKPTVPGLHHPLQARTSSTRARARCRAST